MINVLAEAALKQTLIRVHLSDRISSLFSFSKYSSTEEWILSDDLYGDDEDHTSFTMQGYFVDEKTMNRSIEIATIPSKVILEIENTNLSMEGLKGCDDFWENMPNLKWFCSSS